MMATIISLVTKPFWFWILAFMFGFKTLLIVIHTWLELMKASIKVHLKVFRNTVIWIIALISLPVRVLTAMQRERLLEEHLHEMQIELENLVWHRKELEGQLQNATNDCRILESLLTEVEEENDRAIAKIELLEGELQNQKVENLQLKEMQGMRHWSSKGHDDPGGSQHIGIADNYGISYGIQSWKSGYRESGTIFQDLMIQKDAWEDEDRSKAQLLNFLKTGSRASAPTHPFAPGILDMNAVMEERREVALMQSLFSAVLSVLVGMVIWEAKDPCMPLVVALFIVVGISLKSVVEFFSTIKNKPACEAVALLSFNWFMLGTIAYPTLPRVARMFAPLASRFFYQTISWLRISSN